MKKRRETQREEEEGGKGETARWGGQQWVEGRSKEREESVKVKDELPGFLNSFGIRAEFDPDANPVKVTQPE